MVKGHHHFHIRKRIYEKGESYPHDDKAKRFLDKIIFFIGNLGPIMTIPQIIKIWSDKNASGVAVSSWVAFTITSFFWLLYGIAHKEKPIIITFGLWVVFDIIVIIGALIYG